MKLVLSTIFAAIVLTSIAITTTTAQGTAETTAETSSQYDSRWSTTDSAMSGTLVCDSVRAMEYAALCQDALVETLSTHVGHFIRHIFTMSCCCRRGLNMCLAEAFNASNCKIGEDSLRPTVEIVRHSVNSVLKVIGEEHCPQDFGHDLTRGCSEFMYSFMLVIKSIRSLKQSTLPKMAIEEAKSYLVHPGGKSILTILEQSKDPEAELKRMTEFLNKKYSALLDDTVGTSTTTGTTEYDNRINFRSQRAIKSRTRREMAQSMVIKISKYLQYGVLNYPVNSNHQSANEMAEVEQDVSDESNEFYLSSEWTTTPATSTVDFGSTLMNDDVSFESHSRDQRSNFDLKISDLTIANVTQITYNDSNVFSSVGYAEADFSSLHPTDDFSIADVNSESLVERTSSYASDSYNQDSRDDRSLVIEDETTATVSTALIGTSTDYLNAALTDKPTFTFAANKFKELTTTSQFTTISNVSNLDYEWLSETTDVPVNSSNKGEQGIDTWKVTSTVIVKPTNSSHDLINRAARAEDLGNLPSGGISNSFANIFNTFPASKTTTDSSNSSESGTRGNESVTVTTSPQNSFTFSMEGSSRSPSDDIESDLMKAVNVLNMNSSSNLKSNSIFIFVMSCLWFIG